MGPWGHRASFLLLGVVHWSITFDLFRGRCAGLPEAQNPLQSTSKGPSEVEPSSMPGSQHNIKAQGSMLKQTSRSGYTVPAYMALHAHSVPGKSLQTLAPLSLLVRHLVMRRHTHTRITTTTVDIRSHLWSRTKTASLLVSLLRASEPLQSSRLTMLFRQATPNPHSARAVLQNYS